MTGSTAKRQPPVAAVFAISTAGLIGGVLLALSVGEVDISPAAAIGILFDHGGVDLGIEFTEQQDSVLWAIRLPRVVLGVLVGAALGVSGAALQGIFRNPLADPQLIGISSGAALGSAIAVLALESLVGSLAGPAGAVVGGLVAGIAVYGAARYQGRTEVVTLVLAGIAVAAIGGAGAAFLSVFADDPRLGSPIFYSLGTLGLATWRLVAITLPFVVVAIVLLPTRAASLDLVLLGEREASHLGVDIERLRLQVMVLVSLGVGGVVAAAGVIGFVGLLVPHAIRIVVGPGHRVLLPASALGGAALVVISDVVARTVASPLEVPIGLLTAIVGGPLFLGLLRKTRREHGGWG